jgi:hypothetical protein
MKRRGPCWVGAFALVLALTSARSSRADDAASVTEARKLFLDGSALHDAKRYDEALAVLKESRSLVSSPNTTLLIARCLSALRRHVEAHAAYVSAEEEARRRVLAGEARYEQTADAAASERTELGRTLGTIVMRAPRASTGVIVDGAPVAIPSSGEITIVHEPGRADVVVRTAAGSEQHQIVTVLAGTVVHMEFSETAPPPSPVPAPNPNPDRATSRAWTTPAAWISGAVAVGGLGTFVGFGVRTRSVYAELEDRCASVACGSDAGALSLASEGERTQTIANIGLVVAGVATLAFVTFMILGAN